MSNQSKQPWGDVVAPVQSVDASGETKSSYVKLGVAWYNEKDGKKSFAVTLEAEPIAWREPGVKHTILIQQRVQRNNAR